MADVFGATSTTADVLSGVTRCSCASRRHTDRAWPLRGPKPHPKNDRPDESATCGRRQGALQWKTVPQGAATSVWAGVVAPADEIGGRYCENCHVGNIVPDGVTISAISAISEGLRGYALDPNTAEALWKKSEELVGETF